MAVTVKVTRRGQTTIPLEFREKFNIREGDQLVVEARDDGLLLRVIPKLEKLAGVYAKYGRVDDIKRELEELREEY